MYNEEAILPKAAKRLCDALERDFAGEWQIVFSDDGSRDKSAETVRELMKGQPRIKLSGTPENHGKGSAVRYGMMAADGEYILFTDCDLAYGTDVIRTAYDTVIKNGTDVLIGTRYAEGGDAQAYSLLRRIMSSTYRMTVRMITGFKHSDSQCGLKIFSKGCTKDVFSRCSVDRFAFDLEALLIAERLGYTISELPVSILEDQMRESSKVNIIKDTARMLRDLIKIRKKVKNATYMK